MYLRRHHVRAEYTTPQLAPISSDSTDSPVEAIPAISTAVAVTTTEGAQSDDAVVENEQVKEQRELMKPCCLAGRLLMLQE